MRLAGRIFGDYGKDNFAVTAFNGNRGLNASFFTGPGALKIKQPSISRERGCDFSPGTTARPAPSADDS